MLSLYNIVRFIYYGGKIYEANKKHIIIFFKVKIIKNIFAK